MGRKEEHNQRSRLIHFQHHIFIQIFVLYSGIKCFRNKTFKTCVFILICLEEYAALVKILYFRMEHGKHTKHLNGKFAPLKKLDHFEFYGNNTSQKDEAGQ